MKKNNNINAQIILWFFNKNIIVNGTYFSFLQIQKVVFEIFTKIYILYHVSIVCVGFESNLT